MNTTMVAAISGVLLLVAASCVEVSSPVSMADSGSIMATVNTTVSGGTISPMSNYRLQIWEGGIELRGTNFSADTSSTLRDPDTGVFSLPPGSYTTTFGRLAGIAPTGDRQFRLEVPEECTVNGQNPRTVAVPVFATAQTAFEVSCTAD